MVGFPKPGNFTLKLSPLAGTYAEDPRWSASVSCLSVQLKYLMWINAERGYRSRSGEGADMGDRDFRVLLGFRYVGCQYFRSCANNMLTMIEI